MAKHHLQDFCMILVVLGITGLVGLLGYGLYTVWCHDPILSLLGISFTVLFAGIIGLQIFDNQ